MEGDDLFPGSWEDLAAYSSYMNSVRELARLVAHEDNMLHISSVSDSCIRK